MHRVSCLDDCNAMPCHISEQHMQQQIPTALELCYCADRTQSLSRTHQQILKDRATTKTTYPQAASHVNSLGVNIHSHTAPSMDVQKVLLLPASWRLPPTNSARVLHHNCAASTPARGSCMQDRKGPWGAVTHCHSHQHTMLLTWVAWRLLPHK
jgi:hypothetical protein